MPLVTLGQRSCDTCRGARAGTAGPFLGKGVRLQTGVWPSQHVTFQASFTQLRIIPASSPCSLAPAVWSAGSYRGTQGQSVLNTPPLQNHRGSFKKLAVPSPQADCLRRMEGDPGAGTVTGLRFVAAGSAPVLLNRIRCLQSSPGRRELVAPVSQVGKRRPRGSGTRCAASR